MRLRDIHAILAGNVGLLAHSYTHPALPNGHPGGNLDRYTTWFPATQRLQQIPVLKKYAQAVLSHPLMAHPTDTSIFGPRAEADALLAALQRLQTRAADYLTLLSELLPKEQSPNAVSVKLPEFSSFEELSDVIEELQRIFDVPNRRLHGDGFTVTGFDVGSQWIEMATALLPVLTSTAWLIRVADKYLKGRLDMQTAVDRLKMADGSVDRHITAVVEANERVLKEGLRDACTALVEAHDPADVAVKTESVTLFLDAAERLTGLMERGAAVKLALNAPKTAKDALPGGKDIAELFASIKSASKLLGSGSAPAEPDEESDEPDEEDEGPDDGDGKAQSK